VDPTGDTLPVLADVAMYRGTYYGIEIGRDANGNLTAPTIATATSSEVCVAWSALTCTPGTSQYCVYNRPTNSYIDQTPVYALAVDVSNGTLFSTQYQYDGNFGGWHYRIYKWVP
jgi:hypothetical protein